MVSEVLNLEKPIKNGLFYKECTYFSTDMIFLFPLKHGTKRNKEEAIAESSKKSMGVTSCKLGKKKIL